jgi:hypothetical protein
VATTYVYAAVEVDDPVGLGLVQLGPHNISARQDRDRLPPRSGERVQIAQIPRVVDENLYTLTLPFSLMRSLGASYVASLEVLIRGHGFGSMIWWRWRTAAAAVGRWVTDHDPHSVVCVNDQRRYRFTIQGGGSGPRYDDIYVALRSV